MSSHSLEADVGIVGAGLSGLAAADRLRAAGLEVRVLDARPEVGGRTMTRELNGAPVDFGAEWFGSGHRRVRSLVARLGLRTEPAGQLGRPVRWRLPGTEAEGRLPPRGTRLELARTLLRARSPARRLDPVSPWTSPDAAELDRHSLSEWIRMTGVGSDAESILASLIGALASAPIERVSLLHVLWWVRRGGGPLKVLGTTFQNHLPEGTQSLSHGLARRFAPCISLDTRVRSLEQNGVVRVQTDQGTLSVRRAIVTGSPSGLSKLGFDPELPPRLAELSSLRTDPGTKVVAILPRDRIPRHATVLGRRKLWGAWRHADRVTGFAPPPDSEESADQLVGDLARAFDVVPEDLQSVAVQRWADDVQIPGCDISFAPGELTRLGPSLRQSHGLIHFAGTERSSWPNNMEGALESGQEVADQVLRELAQRNAHPAM